MDGPLRKFRSWLRRRALRRAVRDMERVSNRVPEPQAERLQRAWGDPERTLPPDALSRACFAAASAMGTIVLHGAGAAALALAWASRDRQVSIVCFETDADRAERLQREVDRLRYARIDVRRVQQSADGGYQEVGSLRRPVAFVVQADGSLAAWRG